MLTLILGMVTLALALLGVLARTTHDDKEGSVKKPTPLGWIVMGLLLLSFGIQQYRNWTDARSAEALRASGALWQRADLRMKLLDVEVKTPICSFVTELTPSSSGNQHADLFSLLFPEMQNADENVPVGYFDLVCSPGGDWHVSGLFSNGLENNLCFSSINRICNVGVILSALGQSPAQQLTIVDKSPEPANAARWLAGYPAGKEVARLTFPTQLHPTIDSPAPYWSSLLGDAVLLFEIDANADIWLRVRLRMTPPRVESSETTVSWIVAEEPKLGIVE